MIKTLKIIQGTEDGVIELIDPYWPPTTKYVTNDNDTTWIVAVYDGLYYFISRVYLRFNTALIPHGAKIVSVRLNLRLTAKWNADNLAIPILVYKSPTDWDPLDIGDWGCGTLQVGNKDYADLPDPGNWLAIPIDKAYINISGYTALELRGNHENGSAPTDFNGVSFYLSESVSNAPYLEVDYEMPEEDFYDFPLVEVE